MRLAMSGTTEEDLQFAVQLGASDVVGGKGISTDKGCYPVDELVALRERVAAAGLRLTVLSGPGEELTYKWKLGLEGRDEQIDNWNRMLRNMGEAGIPVVCYFISLRSHYGNYGLRTDRAAPGRGGAALTSFDYDAVQGETGDYWYPPVPETVDASEEKIWENAAYFLEATVPVAEEAGVRMALHADDPPISPIGGVARVLRSHDAIRRVLDIVPSRAHGLTLCTGTFGAMRENVIDAIREFGGQGRVHHIHFRSVDGPVPKFSETFIGEGDLDMLEAMKAFYESGVEAPLVEDHIPVLGGGAEKQYRSRAYAFGYIRALMKAAQS